ncbi:hypothetical protein [Desulfogranum mediterraneum]|uniref:hypothetical protein n=1 Tax=Desulfogranum mediterraneum TaxID=160661 RepID=UPI0003F9C0A8|nr:hypothetical protein [Desulfogranum mediterraneum]
MNPLFVTLCAAASLLLPLTAPPAGAFPKEDSAKPDQVRPAATVLQGTISETMNSGGYTYLRLDTAQGKLWVAIPETTVKKGAAVQVLPGMKMEDFSSRSLKRSFATIIFSPGLVGTAPNRGASPHGTPPAAASPAAAAAKASTGGDSFSAALQSERSRPAAPPKAGAMAQSLGSSGAIVPSADIQVDKAEGADSYTVGECFSQARELNNQTVTIRGKVMKVSPRIMGKNWVHLQDGSGSPMKNTHDLVITTQALPKPDTVVTFRGTLHADRDFGAGYRYAVIVEEATLL